MILISSCSRDSNDSSPIKENTTDLLFVSRSIDDSGLDFTNNVNESTYRNSLFFDYFLNGGGVSVGDINNDGLSDVFFSGNDVPNKLFLNLGDLKFKDISSTALPKANKWSTGVNMIDVNKDGFLDIYICNSGIEEGDNYLANQLLINKGNLTFIDEAEKWGVAGNSLSVHSSFFDYDNDGDLDLWVNNHMNFDGNIAKILDLQSKPHQSRVKYRSTLYRNDGNSFADVSQSAGISRETAALGVSTLDLNSDGYIDVYVSNDYDIPDYYFINNGDGTFTDKSKEKVGHTSFYSMGLDVADIDNDQELDMVAVDMTPQDHVRNKVLMASMDSKKFEFLYDYNELTRAYMFNSVQMGMGDGAFSEVGNYMGVSQTEWSWAPLIADFDNDGKKDLYITNGYLKDTKNNDFKRKVDEYKKQNGEEWSEDIFNYFSSIINSTPVENRFYKNSGNKFNDMTNSWSDMGASFSNGAAYADFDNDGDLDLVISNLSQPASLLENVSTKNNYLRVRLIAEDQLVDNAIIKVTSGHLVQRQDYTFSRGFQSSVEHVAHFGLGDHSKVDQLTVTWADGKMEAFDIPKINTIVELAKGKGQSHKDVNTKKVLFTDQVQLLSKSAVHKEMKFNDFAKEILLPQKYSDLGPALAIGDVNGDGNDDFYLGGSNISEPQLYLYKSGKYISSTPQAFINDKKYEDLGALFFDYDGDGDLDLYVASGGGGEIAAFPELTQDRIYQNDGKGNFTKKSDILRPISSSTKAICAIDADKDGDLDLIVGGRNTPGKYPLSSQSYYFENSNGIFRDKTKKVLAEFSGMITDIEKVDINADGWDDVIVTSEWDSPKIFLNNIGVFTSKSFAGLSDDSGWWQSIEKGDFDNDGDIDLVMGNIGENSKFHPSKEKPLGILASDFDDSGTLDIVLTKKYKDNTVPVRGKECSSEQMPMLLEKFPTYEGFATSSIEDILGEDKIEKSYSRSVTNFSSYLAINDGKGGFEIKKLPSAAQWFPIMDMVSSDVDGDGDLDILLVGNKINAEPETPSYDAGRGVVLLNDGKMNFTALNNINHTGINLNGDARAVKILNRKNDSQLYIVANNNGPVQVFK